MTNKRVLVPLAQGCEELEAVTIIDVLTRGGVEVITASLDENTLITASRGVQLVAQTTLDKVIDEEFAMVVLPGGLGGANNLEASSVVIDKLSAMVASGKPVAAICAAPKVLLKAGLLDNKQATSYPGFIDKTPAVGMCYVDNSVVSDGLVTTSQGPATAMEFALTLVQQLCGSVVKEEVAKGLLWSQ